MINLEAWTKDLEKEVSQVGANRIKLSLKYKAINKVLNRLYNKRPECMLSDN